MGKLRSHSRSVDADFQPPKGPMTVEQYLNWDTNHLVEYLDGCLEVLETPRIWHQLISGFLYVALVTYSKAHPPAVVVMAPFKLRVGKKRYREPDLLYLQTEWPLEGDDRYWEKADLVMEILSPDRRDRKRDLIEKPKDYARAGVSEYWIVDWEEQCITVLSLEGGTYRTHGVFGAGDAATSVLLPGFAVSVDAVFAAARRNRPRRKRSR